MKASKGMKLSMMATLIILTLPLVIALVVSIVFFSSELRSMEARDQELYLDKLYDINAGILSMDRDLYQAMLSIVTFHDEGAGLDTATRQTLLSEIFMNNLMWAVPAAGGGGDQ